MCRFIFNIRLSLCFFLACLSLSVMANANDKPAISSFFDNPRIYTVAFSPDGKTVAMVVATQNGRLQLAAMDLEKRNPKIIAGFSNADIGEVQWVNANRLVYTTVDQKLAVGETRYYPGLYAIDKDGGDLRTLVDRVWIPESTASTIIKSKILSGENFFYGVDHSANSESVFVWEPIWDKTGEWEGLRLKRVNTRTGLVEIVPMPGASKEWLIDDNGVPRICVSTVDGIEKIFYRANKGEAWRVISETSAYADNDISPYAIGANGTLYVTSRNGHDKIGLYRFDLTKNAVEGEPIVTVDGYDFSGDLILEAGSGRLLGVRYENDAYSSVWIDEKLKGIQEKIDALLPATINQIRLARDGLSRYVIVRSYSDVQASMYLSFDTQESKLDLIGATFPKIDASKMSQQDLVHFKARDGLDIPAYLTLPKDKTQKNLPLVVLVHGGPYVRGVSWGWDAEVQFLASRGYAVLQPEFRGSTGYGFAHFKAGWKQWGMAMQDDIADGANWLIARGIVDPKKVCIAGASYGGYATLMGLAKNPELFKCGVNWIGVTDIMLMYNENWGGDFSSQWRKYGMPKMVGDPVKDVLQLKANSPVEIADKITQPLLMAYGSADRRVPIEHGEKFYSKVKKNNPNVEWIRYLDEGHGWGLPQTRIDFWGKVEIFLEKNIGEKAQ